MVLRLLYRRLSLLHKHLEHVVVVHQVVLIKVLRHDDPLLEVWTLFVHFDEAILEDLISLVYRLRNPSFVVIALLLLNLLVNPKADLKLVDLALDDIDGGVSSLNHQVVLRNQQLVL